MKFPRKVRIIRGQLDIAAFVGVLFLLVIFMLWHSSFVFIPGVRISLPEAAGLAGTTNATVTIAVDAHGQVYFRNQLSSDSSLKEKLSRAVAESAEPLTLVVQADGAASHHVLMRLSLLAREAGIREALFAVRPVPMPLPRAAQAP